MKVLVAAQCTKALEPKEYFFAVSRAPPLSNYDLETTHEGLCDDQDLGILESMILSVLTNITKLRR